MRKFHKNFYFTLFTFALSCLFVSLFAQSNNLKVNFKDAASAPRNLNVCGDEVTVTVAVATEGLAASARQNIQAQLNLFKGVQLVRFESSGSSAGVALTNSSDPNRPMFSLPTLSPNSTSSVNIQYVVKVNCSYTDTLTQNDALDVVDKWDFTYDLGATTGLTESDLSTEYRDQIKVPFFTMSVSNNAPNGARIGQCYTRSVVINNSGLEGFVKGFIYTNLQGAGISVKGVRVNGQTVTFAKTATFNTDGDSLIQVNIPDSLFKLNTRGQGGLADGDILFEPDETVTITEDICIANCDKARVSKHEMAWGCESRFCNTVSRQDIVRLGQGSVNVTFASTGSVPAVPSGYCANGSQTVTFTNSGVEVDAGTGTMFDIKTGVGLNEAIVLASNGYRITGIKVGGVTIPTFTTALIDLKDNPLFSTNPDGAGGLEDIDGDGFYDDLAINEKFEITVNFEVDCAGSVSNKNDNCTNDFEASFSAKLEYTDLCQNRSNFLQERFFAPSNTNDYIENCVDPDAKTDGSIFFIEHLEIRNVFNFEKNCNGQEKMLLTVKMPQGVTPVRDSMYMHWFEIDMPLLDMRVSNDTAYLIFDATTAQYITGEYRTRLAFKANCTTPPGISKFPIEMALYCPPCDCRHNWYCDTINGPRIHYTEGVCPPNPAYNCAKGLKTTDFKVDRTTFGFTDETYTTRITAAEANTKVAMACDSIQMTMKNVVGQTPISDSIGLLISYDNISRGDTNKLKDIFIFDTGRVTIKHGGNTYNCAIDASKVRAVRTDTTKALYFDLHSCLVGLGIAPLVLGDSVNFVGNFSVNSEAPMKFTFEKVMNFRAYGYYVEDDSLYSCDNYGAMFRVGKSQALFSFPSSSSFPVGCSEGTLEYKITLFNNDYVKYFGEEYRQSVGVDSFALDFDKNFTQSFTTSVEVSIADHPVFGNNYFPMSNLTNSGHYAARFDTLTRVPSLNKLTAHAFNLRIKIKPNCGTVTGSENGDSVYSFKPIIYYRDRYYARSFGDGSCSPYKIERNSAGNDHITHSGAPILKFTPITNPSITIVNDTAEWTMKLCNESEKGGATVSWMGIAPKTAAPSFRVLSMTDITNNLTHKVLPFKYYGTDSTKAYTFLDGLTAVTPTQTIDDVCNVVKVVAIYRECAQSNIDFKAGWLCAKPTDSLTWNPTKYAPCADSTIQAQVRTENPFIDANFINQSLATRSEICDTTTLEVLLRNTDLGTIYDIKTRLTIPLTGATLIPATISVAYPSGSAYKTVTQAPVFISNTQRGKNYEFNDFTALSDYLRQHGLKGFNPSSPNDSNEMKIRFQFTTDCDYRSGSLAYFSFVGKTVCGTSSNFETGESLPIQIQGATLTSPKLYEVTNGANNKFVAGGVTPIEIHFKNLTTTQSDSADEIGVKLPAGVTYKVGSSVVVSPSSWIITEPRIRTSGDIQILSWKQPTGLATNEEAVFNFSVNSADSLSCSGAKDMAIATFATKELICNTFGTVCKTEIITTSGGEHYYGIPLSRGGISLLSNLPFYNDTLGTLAGDSVAISALGGQSYKWTDADNSTVLSTDSLYKFVPQKPLTRITVKSALASGCLDSAKVFVKVVSALERRDTIYIRDSMKFCFSTLNFTGAIDSIDNTCKTTSNRAANYTVDANNCLIFKGLKLGTDTACFRVCAGLSNCKEIKFYTTVILRPIDSIRVKLDVGDKDTVCFSTKNLKGKKFTLNNICPNPLDTVATYTTLNDTCVVITAIGVGTSKSCWVLCDTVGNCDTSIVVTTVTPRSIGPKRDTIFKTVDIGKTDTVCLNFNRPRTKPIKNVCPDTSGTVVQFEVYKDSCVIIKGVSVGKTLSCWVVCDTLNVCDTIPIVVTVTRPSIKRDTIFRTVEIGRSDTLCLPSNRIRISPIRNICPDTTNKAVEFIVYKDTCIISNTKTIGKGISCWVICDTFNKCDTVVVVTTVINGKLPIAIEDTASTKINTMVTIPVLQNDTTNGKLKSIKLMVQPFFGTGNLVQDSLTSLWTYEYVPNKDFCGSKKLDAFIYEICNDYGCDTAFIKVKVLCNGLKIFNGFSPNSDDKNDFFTIEGIEEYPNTKVIIYNRWGNRVYLNNDYKNNWDGTWRNTLVPDGTYFYQVILENGEQFTGYLEILR